MRHLSSSAVNMESRLLQGSNERSSTLDYQHTLSLLEEDWNNSQMGTPSSVSSSLFDICRCCGRQDCDNLEYFNRNIKKLESDTRLAAEIGQGLLHKHETFVTESNQQKTQLEKQLEECHERITGLEQSLDEVENQKDHVLKEKNKWLWEYQKRQKILDETLSDLEIANDKYNQISVDFDSKTSELEKLRIFKFMVRHSETREESLISKLEDTNQELALCRRNELVLESKIKKLKMRYESLYNSHEQLARDVEDKMDATLVPTINTVDPIKLVSSSNNNTDDLISLIKELSSANTKLKSDLMNCREQLSEARGEVTSLMQKMDDIERGSEDKILCLQEDLMKKSTSSKTMDLFNEISRKKPKRAASVKEKKLFSNKRDLTPLPIKSKTAIQPLPTVSSSMPTSTILSSSPASSNAIVHHHYHYHVKNSKGERVQVTDEMESNSSNDVNSSEFMLDCCDTEKNDIYTAAAMDMGLQHNSREIVLSPSTSSVMTIKDGTLTNVANVIQSPYILLQEHVTQVLERLRGSDIRALNRRLKRAFDIIELSSMSNSVIDNILMEIETLESRFLWINREDLHLNGFFPLLDVLKDMLKELGILRTTMNELQVEYVKKVQESEVRVEQEIIKKRLLKRQTQPEKTQLLSSWITSIFYKTNHAEDDDLTKTITNSSTLIIHPDDDDLLRKDNNINNKSRTRPFDKRRQIPHYPSPQMTTSNSNGTSRSSPSIPIRNKRSLHRMPIDYEGIGPATIRPIPSDPAVNFSSSWLGGK